MRAKLFGNLSVSGTMLILLTYALTISLVINGVPWLIIGIIAGAMMGIGAVIIWLDVQRLDSGAIQA